MITKKSVEDNLWQSLGTVLDYIVLMLQILHSFSLIKLLLIWTELATFSRTVPKHSQTLNLYICSKTSMPKRYNPFFRTWAVAAVRARRSDA